MEDLRKNNNVKKKEGRNINVFAVIMGFFRYIRSKWKAMLFWAAFILIINIVFNPKNTAEFMSNWYDNFIGTIIDNHDNKHD